ncbi:MAG: acyl-CoA synthetase [Pseudomonadota bacterium]
MDESIDKSIYFSSISARDAFEQERSLAEHDLPKSIIESLKRARDSYADRPALSFQLTGDPNCSAVTWHWSEVVEKSLQFAGLLRRLGITSTDKVAYLLPNTPETVISFLGGMAQGVVVPINPLLEPEQIAHLLTQTGAAVLVTLKPLPKVDIAQRAAAAAARAPLLSTIIEVDLANYLSGVKRLAVRLLRPRVAYPNRVNRVDFEAALTADNDNNESGASDTGADNRCVACFHTGGTTGSPKLVQHFEEGVLFNGWLGASLLFSESSVALCPLPLFHVFGCHAVIMGALCAGAHVVLPSPAGFRGEGVLDHFWHLVERWQATFVIAVPTAMSAMLRRPVDADVSSVQLLLSGSAPLPVALYERFQQETGIEVVEGYGMTEATALVCANPIGGEKKVGSIGIPMPHVQVEVRQATTAGWRRCETDEIGEICARGPGVRTDQLYLNRSTPADAAFEDGFLRTGDLGRQDADGYLWITGRSKDLIIRGGHNIDPSTIEEAFACHPDVALVAAVAQPDAYAGEVPCVYISLNPDAVADTEALRQFAEQRIAEPAAVPKRVAIIDELPLTVIGKISKLALRRQAIQETLDIALRQAGLPQRIATVCDDEQLGLVALVTPHVEQDVPAIDRVLGAYPIPWR